MLVNAIGRERGGVGRTSSRGFSLLEVVIAASIILLTVTAITACVTSASHAEGRLAASMRADRALATVAERLRGLPYCARRLPDPSLPTGAIASDLVAAVFPHALSWRNLLDARFVTVDAEGVEGGSFVTRLTEDPEVVCVARFRTTNGDLLEPEELEGFDVRSSSAPPAPELDLTLSAVVAGRARTYHLVCRCAAHAPVDAEGAQ